MSYGVVRNEANCNSLDFQKRRLEKTAESRQAMYYALEYLTIEKDIKHHPSIAQWLKVQIAKNVVNVRKRRCNLYIILSYYYYII